MKVIGYVRVSTEEQAREGISLAAQEEKLRAYAQLYELELVAVVTDAGASGKSLHRPGLAVVLAALDEGRAEGLLVAKLDRLTRSVRDLGTLLESYFGSRFSLLAVGEQIDTRSAAGRLVLNVLTSVAQWEREAIGERTAAALAHKKAQGDHVGAAPLGMDLVAGRLQKSIQEQTTITRLLDLRAEGLPLREIAARLKGEGHRTKRGGAWHPQTVARVLQRVDGGGNA